MHYKYCFLLLMFWMPYSFASETGYYLSFKSFSYSEPTAIKAIIDDWDERLYSGNVALSYNRAELGFFWNKWRIGLVQRYDYFFKFSSSTAKLIHHIKNDSPLKPGDQYNLKLSANTLEATGLKLSYKHSVGNFNFSLAASYLEGKRFVDGNLSGRAHIVSENNYDYLFHVNYYYSQDKLFDRRTAEPEGQGYAIDFTVGWQPNSQIQVKLEAVDILARMYWETAPRTIATANSSTKEFDENGYVVYKPVVSGLEENQNFTQKIPGKIFIQTKYAYQNKYPILFEYQDYAIKRFYSIGYRYAIDNEAKIDLLYNITAEAIKVHYEGRWFVLEAVTDDIEINKARTFGINFYISKTF